jgi:hypothetical protein
MTSDDQIFLPWSSIMELWQKQDIRAYNYFWDYFFDKDYSPFEQLVQIHKVKSDTNNEFHDSMISVICDAADLEGKQVEIDDICQEGVYVSLNEFCFS